MNSKKKTKKKTSKKTSKKKSVNWRSELNKLLKTMPRGEECVVNLCPNKVGNRGAFLCVECGKKFAALPVQETTLTAKARVQAEWLNENVQFEVV